MHPKLWHLPHWRATAPKRPELAVIRTFDTHTDVKPPGHRHLIEASPDGILLTLQSRITYVNRAGIGLFGARDETQLIDRSFLEFFETTAPAMPQTLIQEIMASGHGGPIAAIGKLHRLDDKATDIELLSAPYRTGGEVGSLLILHALSAEDSAFAALSVPTSLLPLLGAPAALAYISPDRICRFVNPVHEAWFGTARDAVAEHPGESWSAAYAQMQGDVDGGPGRCRRAQQAAPEAGARDVRGDGGLHAGQGRRRTPARHLDGDDRSRCFRPARRRRPGRRPVDGNRAGADRAARPELPAAFRQ